MRRFCLLGAFHPSTMALITFHLLLLPWIGCCVGQSALSEGPVHADFGSSVTLKAPTNRLQNSAVFWHFDDGKEIIHVASVGPSMLRLNSSYQGRARISATNGYLTLGPLQMQDSGEYIVTIISKRNRTDIAKIHLRVRAPTTRTTPTSALPETTKEDTGCCGGQEILPEGPVDAVLGSTVTLKTLVHNLQHGLIIWYFSNIKHHIGTASSSSMMVTTPYQGRASINATSGCLTLGPLKMEDSGVYSIYIIKHDGSTQTAETQLRVLAPPTTTTSTTTSTTTTTSMTTSMTTTSPTSAQREQNTDYFEPLVVCMVLIVVLSAGFLLLLYKLIDNRKVKASHGRNVELPAIQEKWAPASTCEDSTYQSISEVTMAQDHTYSTLTDMRAACDRYIYTDTDSCKSLTS